jgi:hypothetical protein
MGDILDQDRFFFFLQQHSIFVAIQLAAAGLVTYWYRNIPKPGYAAALLGLLAAVMSIHSGMRAWQKIIWMLLLGALLFVEFRAIGKDRADFSAAEASRHAQENDRFQTIAAGLTASTSQGQEHFSATISGIQQTVNGLKAAMAQSQQHFSATISGINQTAAKVTGGDSYPRVIPAPIQEGLRLIIMNVGDNELSELSFVVLDSSQKRSETAAEVLADRSSIVYTAMGSLGPHFAGPLSVISPPKDRVGSYKIQIHARNGATMEVLQTRFNTAAQKWEYRFRIWRDPLDGRDDILLEEQDWTADRYRFNVQ